MVSIYEKGKKIGHKNLKDIDWNLDEWNGSEWCSGESWEHQGVMQVGGNWVLFYYDTTQGHRPYGDMISESKAKALLSKRNGGE